MDKLFEKIAAQQDGHDMDDVWMVGEQLKDICRLEPGCVRILAEDLENPNMGIDKAAGKIKAWADAQRKGRSCVCVPPQKAEQILREFYGLPDAGAAVAPVQEAKAEPESLVLDFSAFLG